MSDAIIEKTHDAEHKKRWDIYYPDHRLFSTETVLQSIGRIVLERYGDVWNIELMDIVRPRLGYGTRLLDRVRDEMRCDLSVRPSSRSGCKFFEKYGATPCKGLLCATLLISWNL